LAGSFTAQSDYRQTSLVGNGPPRETRWSDC
jgi:hypothetical protein